MSQFRVSSAPLDLSEAVAAVTADGVGGISIFIGTVRNESDGHEVTLLEYHAYESMAEKQMAKIGAAIQYEFPGVRVAALHRVGSLSVGEKAVICVAAAAHRGEAFSACRLLIDRIKDEVPIWKREHGPAGPYWVGWKDARCSPEHEHGHARGPHFHD